MTPDLNPAGALQSIHPGLRRLIFEQGWRALSPIQERAIPIILSGEDSVIEAPTAGGKTEAVLFPTLTRAAQAPVDSVRILYLAPLRALLNNLEMRGERYAGACGLYAFKWHGDVGQREKVLALRTPPQLLLTTPESLEAILLLKAEWRAFFAGLQCVIIDEAHNFAAGDRGGHLVSLVERVSRATDPEAVQRIALSATIGNPEGMLKWLSGSSRQPGVRVHVPSQSKQRDFEIAFFDEEADTEETPPAERAAWRQFKALRGVLLGKKAIVFEGSRRKTEALAKAFSTYNARTPREQVRVRTHHSAVSRFYREEAERLIQVSREEGLNAIISTSTLELGIDIGALDLVCQMGALASPSAFLQRVGRTGRRPGKPQVFRGYCTTVDDLILLVATVLLGIRGCSESLRFNRKAYHLLAHQCLCLILQEHGLEATKLWGMLEHAHCFSGITRAEYDALIAHMIEQDYLFKADGLLAIGELGEKTFLGAGWKRLFAVFETGALYEVYHQKESVGTLDARFVESLEPPFHFVLAGRLWLAEQVDIKRHRVLARRTSAGDAPRWYNFGGPAGSVRNCPGGWKVASWGDSARLSDAGRAGGARGRETSGAGGRLVVGADLS